MFPLAREEFTQPPELLIDCVRLTGQVEVQQRIFGNTDSWLRPYGATECVVLLDVQPMYRGQE